MAVSGCVQGLGGNETSERVLQSRDDSSHIGTLPQAARAARSSPRCRHRGRMVLPAQAAEHAGK